MPTILTLFKNVLRKLEPEEVDANFEALAANVDKLGGYTASQTPGANQIITTNAIGSAELNAVAGQHLMLKLNATTDKYAQVGFYEAGVLKWNLFNDYTTDAFSVGNGTGTKLLITVSGELLLGATTADGSGIKLQVSGGASVVGELRKRIASSGTTASPAEDEGLVAKYLGNYPAGIYFKNSFANTLDQWLVFKTTVAGVLTEVGGFSRAGHLLVNTTTSQAGHTIVARGDGTYALAVAHGGTNPYGLWLRYTGATPNGTGNAFLVCGDTVASKFQILSNGNAQNINNSYGAISDLKLKENITSARSYLDELCDVRVVKYSLIAEASPEATHLGVIAQELEQIFPGLVEEAPDYAERQLVVDGVQQYEQKQATAADGSPLFHPPTPQTDESGNILYQDIQRVDQDGNPVFRMEEQPQQQQRRDEAGNLIFLAGPEPGTYIPAMETVMAQVPVPVMEQQPVMEQLPVMVDDPDRPIMERYATGEVTKSVKYSIFVPMLITAVQELSVQVKNLESRMGVLEA